MLHSDFWGTEKPVIAVDIDGTLCLEGGPENWKHYAGAVPIIDEIERLRVVYDKVFIVLWTSRFEADRAVTEKWLAHEKVPYDRLIMGKPVFHHYVDAAAFSSVKGLMDDNLLFRGDEQGRD